MVQGKTRVAMPRSIRPALTGPIRKRTGFQYVDIDRELMEDVLREILPNKSRRGRFIADLEERASWRHTGRVDLGPPFPQLIKGLDLVAHQAEALRATLASAREGTADREWQQVKAEMRNSVDLNVLEDALSDLAAAAHEARIRAQRKRIEAPKARKREDTRGRKADLAKHYRALDVAELFERHTGNLPTVTSEDEGAIPKSLYARLLHVHERAVLNQPNLRWSSVRRTAQAAVRAQREKRKTQNRSSQG
jgi:hypothetical protein